MKTATVVFMLVPFVCGTACYLWQDSSSFEEMFGLWGFSTVACLVWGFFIRRKHRGQAWACVGIGLLQLAIMLLPALRKGKTHSTAGVPPHAAGPNSVVQATAGWLVCFMSDAHGPAAPDHDR